MTTPAITLTNLCGGYGPDPVIEDVSLTVPDGGFVGLIGPSGAGKTSILRAILGSLPWATGGIELGGRRLRPGQPPPPGTGYVPQVPESDWTFPVTVEDVVLMGRIQRMGPWPWPSRRDRFAAQDALAQLGIDHLARRHIRDLSGGQRQRVFLARAFAGEPRLLLLDEPTASVDVATREVILDQLRARHQQGVTIVLTTHDLNAVAATLPMIACVNRTVIAQGSPDRVLNELVLRRTFDASIRVLRDEVTGAPLVVEGATPIARAAD
jgi:ABC-type Mn2+/Zn2+ transport system ATPase subunit